MNYSWYSKSESCSRWGTAWRLFLLLWFVRNEKSKQLRRCDQNCEGFSPSTEKVFFETQSNECFRRGYAKAIWNWMEKLKKHLWYFSLRPRSQFWVHLLAICRWKSEKRPYISFNEIGTENHFLRDFHFWIFHWF